MSKSGIEYLRQRLALFPRKKEWEIMQDLLDAGAIRPDCVDAFKAKIEALKQNEA